MCTLLIAGSKFWHTSKIIRAISEADYDKLERHRNGKAGGSSIVNLISDSSSEEYYSFGVPPKRKRKKMIFVPPPRDGSPSDSDNSQSTPSPPLSKYRATVDVEKVLMDVKQKLFKSSNEMPPDEVRSAQKQIRDTVCAIFTCIICKEVTTEDKVPIMPTCCNSTFCCTSCLEQWLSNAGCCPHCRHPLTMSSCHSQPLIKPLFDFLGEHTMC